MSRNSEKILNNLIKMCDGKTSDKKVSYMLDQIDSYNKVISIILKYSNMDDYDNQWKEVCKYIKPEYSCIDDCIDAILNNKKIWKKTPSVNAEDFVEEIRSNI